MSAYETFEINKQINGNTAFKPVECGGVHPVKEDDEQLLEGHHGWVVQHLHSLRVPCAFKEKCLNVVNVSRTVKLKKQNLNYPMLLKN